MQGLKRAILGAVFAILSSAMLKYSIRPLLKVPSWEQIAALTGHQLFSVLDLELPSLQTMRKNISVLYK